MGKPASRISTPSSTSFAAMRSFSGTVMLQPGDCSPSRSVVSKIQTRLFIVGGYSIAIVGVSGGLVKFILLQGWISGVNGWWAVERGEIGFDCAVFLFFL